MPKRKRRKKDRPTKKIKVVRRTRKVKISKKTRKIRKDSKGNNRLKIKSLVIKIVLIMMIKIRFPGIIRKKKVIKGKRIIKKRIRSQKV